MGDPLFVSGESPPERPPDQRYGSGHAISQGLAREMGLPPYSVKEILVWNVGDGTHIVEPVFQSGYLHGGGMPFPPASPLVGDGSVVVSCPHRFASIHTLLAMTAFHGAVDRAAAAGRRRAAAAGQGRS